MAGVLITIGRGGDQLSPARNWRPSVSVSVSAARRDARFPGLGEVLPTEKKIDQAFVRLGRVLGRRRLLIPASDVTGGKSRDLPIPLLVDGLPLGEKSFGLGSPSKAVENYSFLSCQDKSRKLSRNGRRAFQICRQSKKPQLCDVTKTRQPLI